MVKVLPGAVNEISAAHRFGGVPSIPNVKAHARDTPNNWPTRRTERTDLVRDRNLGGTKRDSVILPRYIKELIIISPTPRSI
jgi:hypothetical protein